MASQEAIEDDDNAVPEPSDQDKGALSPVPQDDVLLPAQRDDVSRGAQTGSMCSGCHNGGQLLSCDFCYREICTRQRKDEHKACITLNAGIDIDNPKIQFMCPACHVARDKYKPYVGFYINGQPCDAYVHKVRQVLTSFFPELRCKKMLIIQINLEGTLEMDEPVIETLCRLKKFFSREKVAIDLKTILFNFKERKRGPNGTEVYAQHLKPVIKSIPEYKNVLIFFTTHATPTGDLHFLPKNMGAESPEVILDEIFPIEFCAALKKVERSMLYLLVCHGVSNPQCYQWVREQANSGVFTDVLSFSSGDFQPYYAAHMCAYYAQRFLIENARFPVAMPEVLQGSHRLGTSSKVVVFKQDCELQPMNRKLFPATATQFYWSQRRYAPYGIRAPTDCRGCKRFQTIRTRLPPPNEENPTTFAFCCKQCKYTKTKSIPVGREIGTEERGGSWHAEDFLAPKSA
ncbi:hypothetical protein HGRIS_003980 [Hohenbuehelia grisea]|uniref:Uncharacterized protein n=1 Tax=Hohenbuehelia grisea TaxID=104357 RepID=A0ABR3JHA6_9AGAR